jgi:hypothetical protein
MSRGKTVLIEKRLKWLSHTMNIPPLITYTPTFIKTVRKNYELRENVVNTSSRNIELTAMRFQWLPHIMDIPHWETIYRFLLKSSEQIMNYDNMYQLRPEVKWTSYSVISMIITYNEYHPTENLYTDFYWNRGNQLRITRKYINYVQG